jgi:hypothetical protein
MRAGMSGSPGGSTGAESGPARRLRRHGWLIFFLLGAGALVTGPIILLGYQPEPPSAEGLTGLSLAQIDDRIPGVMGYVRSLSTQLGNFILAMGAMLAAIAAGPFRRGERWAWYTLWIVPVLVLIQFLNSQGGLGWQLDLALVPITVVALIATRPLAAE